MFHNEEKSFDLKFASEFANFLFSSKNASLNDENATKSLFGLTGWQIMIYTVASFALFLFIVILCGICYKHILLRSCLSRKTAYNDLVKHGFFQKWIIQDLSYIAYNPDGAGSH